MGLGRFVVEVLKEEGRREWEWTGGERCDGVILGGGGLWVKEGVFVVFRGFSAGVGEGDRGVRMSRLCGIQASLVYVVIQQEQNVSIILGLY